MQSNPSSSLASSPRRSWFDPAAILLPIFLGALRAAPHAAFFAMFLGPEFGLSNGHEAPSVWALAILSAVAFWSVAILTRWTRNPIILNLALLLIGVVGWGIWMGIEPDWHVGTVVRDPISMVTSEGQFGWVFVITLVFWILTLRLALDQREQSPEGVRGIAVRSLVGVLAGTMLAAFIDSPMGEDGLQASYIALGVALISGIGAVGISEMASTRAAARRRGATVPSWNRWSRTFAGSSAIILVVLFVAALVFGPGFLELIVDVLRTIWSGIATVLLYIVYGVVYAFVYIYRAVAWLLNLLFDTQIQPMEMPEAPDQATQEPEPDPLIEESQPWKYAGLLRFGGLVGIVVIALLVLARLSRYRNMVSEADPNEERSSVFSGSLLRNQISNLFRRKPGVEKPRKLDLASDPASVRESMLYLQVLAERLGVARAGHETPHDFIMRLSDDWPDVQAHLQEIGTRYERVRYGESEEDRAAAVGAWRGIWADRGTVPEASGSH